jgi:hypothetical protein
MKKPQHAVQVAAGAQDDRTRTDPHHRLSSDSRTARIEQRTRNRRRCLGSFDNIAARCGDER